MTRHPRFLFRDAIRSGEGRAGGAMVELALVVSIFFLFMFGLLEYCRLVYVRQIVTNASREGARYAVANAANTTVVNDTKAVVLAKMCNLDTKTNYYNCSVYQSDSSGNNIGNAGDAAFGSYIAVQVDYDYTPSLPTFLKMGNTIRITSRDLMFSEAN